MFGNGCRCSDATDKVAVSDPLLQHMREYAYGIFSSATKKIVPFAVLRRKLGDGVLKGDLREGVGGEVDEQHGGCPHGVDDAVCLAETIKGEWILRYPLF